MQIDNSEVKNSVIYPFDRIHYFKGKTLLQIAVIIAIYDRNKAVEMKPETTTDCWRIRHSADDPQAVP
jgi:hypothetical protein